MGARGTKNAKRHPRTHRGGTLSLSTRGTTTKVLQWLVLARGTRQVTLPPSHTNWDFSLSLSLGHACTISRNSLK